MSGQVASNSAEVELPAPGEVIFVDGGVNLLALAAPDESST